MKKVTQQERLLKHLKENSSVTPMTAFTKLGIYRLAACVHSLKKAGVKIKARRVNVENRFGDLCRVAQYKLVE